MSKANRKDKLVTVPLFVSKPLAPPNKPHGKVINEEAVARCSGMNKIIFNRGKYARF